MSPLLTIRRGLIAASGGVAGGGVTFGNPQVAFVGDGRQLSVDEYGGDNVIVAYYKNSQGTVAIRAGNIVNQDVSWGSELSINVGVAWGNSISVVKDDGSDPYHALFNVAETGFRTYTYPIRIVGTSLTAGTRTDLGLGGTQMIINAVKIHRDDHAMVYWREQSFMNARVMRFNSAGPDTVTALDEDTGTQNAGHLPTAWENLRVFEAKQDRVVAMNRERIQTIDYDFGGNVTTINSSMNLAIGSTAYGAPAGVYISESDTFFFMHRSSSETGITAQIMNVGAGNSLSVAVSQTLITGHTPSDIQGLAAVRAGTNRMFLAYDRSNSHYLTDISRSGQTLTVKGSQVINASDPNVADGRDGWEPTAIRVQPAANRVIAPYRASTSAVGVVIGTYT